MPLNRRDFLQKTALTTSGLALGPVFLPRRSFSLPLDFKLTILATNWGFAGSFAAFCAAAKEEGYDGVEIWLPGDDQQVDEYMRILRDHDLSYGFLAGTGGADFKTHFKAFQKSVDRALAQEPLFVNCHSGRDYFTEAQCLEFFRFTQKRSTETGIPIYHETHRARILFAAHIARGYLETLPELKLTLDISHWCNVHSSMLQDQEATVDLALARTGHIHSRVGQPQAPQVNDPRAPEWADVVAQHFAWWDKVVERYVANGETLTMTPEFGPPDYMPTVPFTQQPITDLWAINAYMKDLWRERYQS
ncbi:MAG TPA: twin-arginine translocation signal domain-containing protein [Saprospiraceae bacterium]|nr:twin-arginine translocation signal domain-containing protein [Saprospiraceae bacterium]